MKLTYCPIFRNGITLKVCKFHSALTTKTSIYEKVS